MILVETQGLTRYRTAVLHACSMGVAYFSVVDKLLKFSPIYESVVLIMFADFYLFADQLLLVLSNFLS